MVDPIGIKTGPVVDRRPVSAVGATVAAAAPKPVVAEAGPERTEAAELARAMAATPPVDAERVARIRKAVEEGRFPLLPATVADRLLALKLHWNPNDAS